MKRFFLLLLLGCTCATGCSNLYTIRLSNGSTLTSRGRPHFDEQRNLWVYKDGTGAKRTVSALRVAEVAPASQTQSQFISK